MLAALLAAACGSAGPQIGTAGADCYPNATCDPGLVCEEGVCLQGEDTGVGLPELAIVSAPAARTNESQARFEIACGPHCHLRCRLNEGAEGPCISPMVYGGLDDGEHRLEVRGMAPDGRATEPVVHVWVVDTVVPELEVLSAPAERVRETTAAIDATCSKSDCVFECSKDGSVPEACTFPLTFTDLEDGMHALWVVIRDEAGNRGTASVAWEVDTVAPTVTIVSGPEAETVERAAVFDLLCDKPGCQMFCRLDGGEVEPCASPYAVGGLELGERLFEVYGEDDLGPGEPSSHAWRIVPNAWEDLGLGFGRTCGVRRDGTLWCWGRPIVGTSPSPVPESDLVKRRVGTADDWVQVSAAGDRHACAILGDGTAWCWGSNWRGQLGDYTTQERSAPNLVGLGETGWIQVATAREGSCGIRQGDEAGLYCWGSVAGVPSDERLAPWRVVEGDWRSVTMSFSHHCAIRDDGTLWCWGNNGFGQLGDGTGVGSSTPVQVGEESDWEAVGVGRDYTCGLRGGGEIWCWGRGRSGAGGEDIQEAILSPRRLGDSAGFRDLVVASQTSCALDAEGAAWCWGSNADGQLADPDLDESATPVRVAADRPFTRLLTERANHLCAIDEAEETWCWGLATSGEIGDGVPSDKQRPWRVDGGWAAGQSHSGVSSRHGCGVHEDGALHCWGQNQDGAVGPSPRRYLDWPVPLLEGRVAVSVGVGSGHTCALDSDDRLWCWGRNWNGTLGDGTTESTAEPVEVGTGGWTRLAAGLLHNCALRTDGSLWCWGRNAFGEIGDGTTEVRLEPVRVGEEEDWLQVSSGLYFSCGIRVPGSLWCWGSNGYGQVGDGTTEDRHAPVRVGADEDWVQVGAGRFMACGLRGSGTLSCWGGGELPAGQVGEAGEWAELFMGWETACATRHDGSLWCWGENGRGEVGDGTLVTRTTPVLVSDEPGWVGMAHSWRSRCAFRDDGSRWCWGVNDDAQLGDGTRVRFAPARVLEPEASP